MNRGVRPRILARVVAAGVTWIRGLTPIREGWSFVVGFGLTGLGCVGLDSLWGRSLGVLFLVASGLCLYFFRDPPRQIPTQIGAVLSPADGRVLTVEPEPSPLSGTPGTVIRIFLSVFDPHIQRAPVAGMVTALHYQPGKFLDARHPEACRQNEQNRIVIAPQHPAIGGEVIVTQIAGFLARRIACWVEPRQPVALGQRVGLIRFGSQVDLWLPRHLPVQVKPGDPLKAGLSVVAFIDRGQTSIRSEVWRHSLVPGSDPNSTEV